ncbi:hypothetical protein EGJ86_18475 [Pseudomonas sp. o96-267]|uniref:hypothetical protein n=1 Tax=Pseudomonas sp. o96-267 TaxID=2479853 RepID=UPI000F78C811|nr:hypothetical protein [Pseudomonas sp. o96-267]RRV32178.1 hypothetical protein EGJ86_18475 [Pseudomonas sp. o96-267]
MTTQAGHIDVEFKSESSGLWCLNKKGSVHWMHITLACSTEKTIVRTISTNDAALVKQILAAPGEGLCVRSFQAVFPCSFPDNVGIGVADVYEFSEGQTTRGEVFHRVLTKFGCYRFGGPRDLMASKVRMGTDVVHYTAKRPAQRYFGN